MPSLAQNSIGGETTADFGKGCDEEENESFHERNGSNE
jgi:hypothetical protein